MLWCVFALHLINCRLYCLFLAAITVVEEEKEEVVKKTSHFQQQQCVIWDTTRVEVSVPHNWCSASDYINGSIRFGTQL